MIWGLRFRLRDAGIRDEGCGTLAEIEARFCAGFR